MQRHRIFSSGRVVLVLALLSSLVSGTASAAELESLERALVGQATPLIKHFKTRGYKNVGVLKFLVVRAGAKSFSDNVGTLNMSLARRLEVALVLANDPRKPIGIVRNASAVAARTTGANHLTKAGRLKLFSADYPLAWGKEVVQADAFVTGTAEISRDLKTLTMSLYAFDPASTRLSQVGKDFTVLNDAGKLAEMGESFVLRGLFDNGEAIFTAAKVAAKEVQHPLADKTTPPVKLEIFYAGKLVKTTLRDGKVFAPDPKEGQKVTFILKRDRSKERFGVVLKVNGENTIEKQRKPDLYCRRWILESGKGPTPITGFQITDTEYQEFRVLSASESKAQEMNYGADVGTITMTVFRENKDIPVVKNDRVSRDTHLVAAATLPENPENYGALKAQLLADSERNLVVAGEVKKGEKVKRVKFKPDPTPVMSVTIIYHKR